MDISAYVINKMRNIVKEAAINAIECLLDEKGTREVKHRVRHQLNGIIMCFDQTNDVDISPVFILEDLGQWANNFMDTYFSYDFKKCDCGNWHYESYCDMCDRYAEQYHEKLLADHEKEQTEIALETF